jgi:hypothetical protein
MVKLSTTTVTALAAALKSALDGGFLYIFDGPVPATAAAATTGATLIATITKDGDGVTGLTFDTPTTGLLSKTAAEAWEGTSSGGTAVFFRFCESGDTDPEAADSLVHRIQGLCGTSPYSAQLIMPTTTLGNGTAVPITAFSFNVPEA